MNINLLSATELRGIIEENINQIGHLRRSQKEITEFLQLESDDAEFLQALQENEDVLQSKLAYVQALKNQLRTVDPACYKQYYGKTHEENSVGSLNIF